jgi:dienelactone hydrolase
MDGTRLREDLAAIFRGAGEPLVNLLLEQYRRDVSFDTADFPLAAPEFDRFQARIRDVLTKSLGDSRWNITAPLTKHSPISDLFHFQALTVLSHERVELETGLIHNLLTGDRIPVVVCLPEGRSRCPAVAVFSGHTNHGIVDLVADPKSYQGALALRLAQAGFATIAVEKIDAGYASRAFHNNAPGGDDENHVATMLLACGKPTVADRQVMASLCALEHLATHPRVDESRIGAAGVSFGGWSAIYAGLLSDRVAAIADFGRKTQLIDMDPAAFQGVSDYSHLFPGLAALCQRNLLPIALAPRRLAVGHGRADLDSDRQAAQIFYRPLVRQYEVLGVPDHVDYYEHSGGDVIPAEYVISYFMRALDGAA